MAGHSKWANIKRRKSAVDAKRGKLFTKIARELQIAARQGGPDPEANIRLRLALDKARAANMPKENIQRAINRGAGLEKGSELEEAVYEGYGPHGVAMLVEVLTDNRNRTVAEVRHVFSKAGGSLAGAGAVAWQFERKGQISVKTAGMDEEDLFLLAVDAGAEDVDFNDDGTAEIITDATELAAVRDRLAEAGIEVESAELTMVPQNEIELPVQDAMKVLNLLENLEDLDDVQKVHSNLALSDELLAEMEVA
ncbi:MAG: YebC/PmpR family DNA-binding transcriptional regulator [Caldilineae bacterium]|nr:MAG: YebC/PmpR family DNA-binding transcriptional regulator [Caldilineae bacterium]